MEQQTSPGSYLHRFFIGQWREIASIAALGAFANSLLLIVPLYSTQVFDRVLTSGSVETLIMLSVLAAVALGFYGVIEAIRGSLLSRLGGRMEREIGPVLLAEEIALARRGKPGSGDSIRDLRELASYVGSPSFSTLLDAPWAPVFTIIIFAIHPALGFVALVASMLLFGAGYLGDRWTNAMTERSRRLVMASSGLSDQYLRNSEWLRAMGLSRFAVARWALASADARVHHMRTADRVAMLSSAARFVRLGVQLAIMGIGVLLVLKQEATAGVVFAASIMLGRALAPVENAITSYKALANARAAYHRLDQALDRVHERSEAAPVELPAPAGAFRLEKVTLRVPERDEPLLDEVSFEFPAGTVLGVVGPSGSGKSTLARLLVGLEPPTSGVVRLDGADLTTWNPDQLGRSIGYLPQDVELLTGTVAENIGGLDPKPEPEAILAAARAANLHETILRLPKGYNTPVGPAGTLLSAGQRQRIGLARALYRDRRILVLDEPNAHLDMEGERQLALAVLAAKNRGCTVIVITHRLSILEVVEKLAVIDGGKLAQYGNCRDVITALQDNARVRAMRANPPRPAGNIDPIVASPSAAAGDAGAPAPSTPSVSVTGA